RVHELLSSWPSFFLLLAPLRPRSSPFPYTTLFRSSSAINDHVCSVWAVEQTAQAVRPVYHAYGAGDNLRLFWRQGSHETWPEIIDRKSTRLNSSHVKISYAVFCLKKKNTSHVTNNV